MKELNIYSPQESENLLTEIKKFLLSKGIMLRQKFSAVKNSEIQSSKSNSDLIKPFIIQTDTPAFYLEINSPDDISKVNEQLENLLTNLQTDLKNFLDTNSDLDSVIADKINTFATSNLTAAKKAFKFNLKKSLLAEIKNCNTIDELREVARRYYGNFLEKEFLQRIMVPLYEGIKQTPTKQAYIWTLGKVNDFLSELGVMTAEISVGDVWNENSLYIPANSEYSKKFSTTNAQEKDTVREILQYAYIFNENRGAENYPIMDGEVIVMVYKTEGAQ